MEDNKQNELQQNNGIDFGVLLHNAIGGIRKFWWILVILSTLTAAGFTFWQSRSYQPVYESHTTFTISVDEPSATNNNSFAYDRNAAGQMAATFPYLLESELLTDMVKHDLDVENVNGIVSGARTQNSNLFTIKVQSNNAQDAKDILDSIVRNFPVVSQYVMGAVYLNVIEAAALPDEPLNSFELCPM